MSETSLIARPAFYRHLDFAGADVPPDDAGLVIQPRNALALAIVVARKGARAPLADRVRLVFGVDLPTGPKRVAAGRTAFIGMGPGQYLAVEEGGTALNFALRLAECLGDTASVSDQSDARAILRVSGPAARTVLAKGLALDLHPSVFGPGDAALSSIALIGAHLWQLDERPTYEIAVFRSMAGSFADFIWSSAAEFGVALGADNS